MAAIHFAPAWIASVGGVSVTDQLRKRIKSSGNRLEHMEDQKGVARLTVNCRMLDHASCAGGRPGQTAKVSVS